MMPENIQNRVRNTLSPIYLLNELITDLLKPDISSEEVTNIYNLIKESKVLDKVDKSIEKLIILAKGIDLKINDETFDIESFIKTNIYEKN